jgi:hypothetical protein
MPESLSKVTTVPKVCSVAKKAACPDSLNDGG